MRPSKSQLENLDTKEIAALFDVTEKTALNWQDYYGLREKGPRLNDAIAAEIRRLRHQKTVAELAMKFDVSLASVYRVLANVTYRKPVRASGNAIVNVQYNV